MKKNRKMNPSQTTIGRVSGLRPFFWVMIVLAAFPSWLRAGELCLQIETPKVSLKQGKGKASQQRPRYSILGLTEKEFQDWLREPNTPEFERKLCQVLNRLDRAGFDRWISLTRKSATIPANATSSKRFLVRGEVGSIIKLDLDAGTIDASQPTTVFQLRLHSVVSKKEQVLWLRNLPPVLMSLMGQADFVCFTKSPNPKEIEDPVFVELPGRLVVEADGLFVGVSSGSVGLSGLVQLAPTENEANVFLAKRLKWKPEELSVANAVYRIWKSGSSNVASDQELHPVVRGWVELGKKGIDVCPFSFPDTGATEQMDVGQGELFHQLLKLDVATGEDRSSSRSPKNGKDLDGKDLDGRGQPKLIDLLRDPQSYRSAKVPFLGTVTQVVKVALKPEDLGRKQGLDHYFLVHIRVRIDQKVKVNFKGGKSREFDRSFPATVAIRRLPKWLEIGGNGRRQIAGEGYFFHLWGFRSAASKELGTLQFAPVLVASRLNPTVITEESSTSHPVATFLMGAVLMTVFGLGLAAIVSLFGKNRKRFFGPAKDYSGIK